MLNPFSYADYNSDLAALNFTGFTAPITDFEVTFDTHTCATDSICSRSSIGPYYNITDAEFGFKWGVSNSTGNPIVQVYMPARGLVSASDFYYGEAVSTTINGEPARENLGIQIWYSSDVYMPMGHITVLQSWIDDIQNAPGGYKVLEAGTTIGYLLNTFPYGGAYGMELWMVDRTTHNGLAYSESYNGDWDKSANILSHFSPELKSYILQKYQPFYEQFLAAGVDAFTDIAQNDASAVNSTGTISGFWYKDDLTDSQDYLANWGRICIVGLDHMSAETYWKTIQNHPGMNGLFVETVGTDNGTRLYNAQPGGNNYMFPVSGNDKEGIFKIKFFYGGETYTYIKYRLDQSTYSFYLDRLTAEGFATQSEAENAVNFSDAAVLFRRNPAPLAHIGGAITYNGQPFAGAHVTISGYSHDDYTTQIGTYSIIVKAGDISVNVSSFGYVSVSSGVFMSSGSDLTLDLALTPLPSTIFGVVSTQGGDTRLQGALVQVLDASTQNVLAQQFTDSGGGYSITDISSGTFSVRASLNGYVTQARQAYITSPGGQATVNFTMTPVQAPPKPDNFRGTDASSSAITWAWDSVAQAEGYRLYTSTGGLLGTTTDCSMTDTGLEPNTLYRRYVEAYNATGSSGSVTAGAYTLATVPGAPNAAATSRTKISASWSSGGDPAGTNYGVQYSTDEYFTGGVSTYSVVSAAAAQLSGLQPSTTYFVRVKALNADSISTAYTSTTSARTWDLPEVSAVSPPSGVAYSTGITLALSGAGFRSGDTAYLLKEATIVQSLETDISNASSASALFSLTGLSSGTWNVVLKDAEGSSSTVSGQSEFSVTLPGGVSGSTVAAAGSVLTDCGVSLSIPANTLAGGAVYISTDPLNSPIKADPARISQAALAAGQTLLPGTATEFVAYDNTGAQVTNPSHPVTVSISYQDANDDGIVDGTSIYASGLFLVWLNTAVPDWEVIAGSVLDPQHHRVYAPVPHLSVFGISGVTAQSTLSGAKAYPNPWKPGSGGPHDRASLMFDGLSADSSIRIYTIAGELVRDLPATSAGYIEWSGKASDGTKVASGVYFARIKSASGSRILKFAIER